MSTTRYYRTDLTQRQWQLLLALLPSRTLRPGSPGRPPYTYQADDVKRANRCIAGAGRPSEEQLVKPSFQAVATDLISVAGHSPCAAPHTSRGSMFSPPLRGEQWFSQKPRPRNTCVPSCRSSQCKRVVSADPPR